VSKINPIRIIYLRSTGRKWYRLYNDKNKPVSERYYCDDTREAIAWARSWVSSWGDVSLEIEI